MQFADRATEKHVLPKRFERAFCPGCGGGVSAKCGELKKWHWAHDSLKDCDAWKSGDMSDWHWNWQQLASEECREITIKRNGEHHRADVMAPSGRIYEFQHSFLSPQKIREREHFYGPDLSWVYDLTEKQNETIKGTSLAGYARLSEGDVSLTLKRPMPALAHITRDLWLDLGGDVLFHVKSNLKDGKQFRGVTYDSSDLVQQMRISESFSEFLACEQTYLDVKASEREAEYNASLAEQKAREAARRAAREAAARKLREELAEQERFAEEKRAARQLENELATAVLRMRHEEYLKLEEVKRKEHEEYWRAERAEREARLARQETERIEAERKRLWDANPANQLFADIEADQRAWEQTKEQAALKIIEDKRAAEVAQLKVTDSFLDDLFK